MLTDDYMFEDDLVINKLVSHRAFRQFEKGKRLRARMTNEFSQCLHIPPEEHEVLAGAIELIHNATLTHDDVIDNSDVRRDMPTFHKFFGIKKAVLIGDYLLASALSQLGQLGRPQLIVEVSHCLKTIVDGEWFQADWDDPFEISEREYNLLAMAKTGSLFSLCLTMPLVMKNASAEEINLYKKIGREIGVVFQRIDDFLDFSERSQKTRYLDLINLNPNFVFTQLETSPKILFELKSFSQQKFLGEEAAQALDNALAKTKEKLQGQLDDLQRSVDDLSLDSKDTARHAPEVREMLVKTINFLRMTL
jgi:octaprenyl-diphosphate synthase